MKEVHFFEVFVSKKEYNELTHKYCRFHTLQQKLLDGTITEDEWDILMDMYNTNMDRYCWLPMNDMLYYIGKRGIHIISKRMED